jgi:hypothetical protein
MAKFDDDDVSPVVLGGLEALHVRLASACVRAIVSDPLMAGGSSCDVMALLETIMVGVLNIMRSMGRDSEEDLEHLMRSVRLRLPEPKPCTVPGLVGRA